MKSKSVAIWLLLFAVSGTLAQASQDTRPHPSESAAYDVKAVFLFRFCEFVTWPASTFPADTSPFVIGILGRDPFGPSLDLAVRDEQINGHPIVIRRLRDASEASECHILFVAAGAENQLTAANIDSSPVLTVGETELFSRFGGMIRFTFAQNRVRMRINLKPVKAAGLEISTKLLLVAERVEGVVRQ